MGLEGGSKARTLKLGSLESSGDPKCREHMSPKVGIAWLYVDAHFRHTHLQPWRSLVKLNECVCFYEWTLVDGGMWNLRKAHSFQVGISLWALVNLLQPVSYPYTSWLPGKENSWEKTHAPCTHVYNSESEGQESATLT